MHDMFYVLRRCLLGCWSWKGAVVMVFMEVSNGCSDGAGVGMDAGAEHSMNAIITVRECFARACCFCACLAG